MYYITMRSNSQSQEKYLYHVGFVDPIDKVLSPKLEFEDNKAGSLEFVVPPTHPYYDDITDGFFKSTVYVYKDTTNIWQGRIVSAEKDFFGNKEVSVEGALAYFNDTYQLNATYTNATLSEFIDKILKVHNGDTSVTTYNKIPDERKIYLGTIDPSLDCDDPDAATPTPKRENRYTSYENTMNVLEDIVNRYGGHMYITIDSSGRPCLNYEKKRLDRPMSPTENQIINFGENLLDYVENRDYSEFASVLLPLGDSIDSSNENYNEYVTISGATAPEGFTIDGPYLKKTEEYNRFGWVCKDNRWDDIKTSAELLKEAVRYLKDLQNNLITLTVKAVDLHYLDTTIDAFEYLGVVNVVSVPHGLNKNFLVTRLTISMDDPSRSEIELGAVVAQPISSTVTKNSSYKYVTGKSGYLVMSNDDINAATPL